MRIPPTPHFNVHLCYFSTVDYTQTTDLLLFYTLHQINDMELDTRPSSRSRTYKKAVRAREVLRRFELDETTGVSTWSRIPPLQQQALSLSGDEARKRAEEADRGKHLRKVLKRYGNSGFNMNSKGTRCVLGKGAWELGGDTVLPKRPRRTAATSAAAVREGTLRTVVHLALAGRHFAALLTAQRAKLIIEQLFVPLLNRWWHVRIRVKAAQLEPRPDPSLLRQFDLFKQWQTGLIEETMPHIFTRKFAPNECIISEGTPSVFVYLVRSGEAEVYAGRSRSVAGTFVASIGEFHTAGDPSTRDCGVSPGSLWAGRKGVVVFALRADVLDRMWTRLPLSASSTIERTALSLRVAVLRASGVGCIVRRARLFSAVLDTTHPKQRPLLQTAIKRLETKIMPDIAALVTPLSIGKGTRHNTSGQMLYIQSGIVLQGGEEVMVTGRHDPGLDSARIPAQTWVNDTAQYVLEDAYGGAQAPSIVVASTCDIWTVDVKKVFDLVSIHPDVMYALKVMSVVRSEVIHNTISEYVERTQCEAVPCSMEKWRRRATDTLAHARKVPTKPYVARDKKTLHVETARTPKINECVLTPAGTAKVQSVDPIRSRCKVRFNVATTCSDTFTFHQLHCLDPVECPKSANLLMPSPSCGKPARASYGNTTRATEDGSIRFLKWRNRGDAQSDSDVSES